MHYLLPDGREVDADDLVGDRSFVQANYSGGDERCVGRVLAYCDSPQFLIETPSGERVWWRADMTRPLPTERMAQMLQMLLDAREATA